MVGLSTHTHTKDKNQGLPQFCCHEKSLLMSIPLSYQPRAKRSTWPGLLFLICTVGLRGILSKRLGELKDSRSQLSPKARPIQNGVHPNAAHRKPYGVWMFNDSDMTGGREKKKAPKTLMNSCAQEPQEVFSLHVVPSASTSPNCTYQQQLSIKVRATRCSTQPLRKRPNRTKSLLAQCHHVSHPAWLANEQVTR